MKWKRITAWLMAVVLVILAGFTVCAQDYSQTYGWHSTLYGDLTIDGVIGATDALEVLKLVVGKLENDRMLPAADTNRNGDVGAEDALEILKYTVGKSSRLDSPKQVTVHMWNLWQRVAAASGGKSLYRRTCQFCTAYEEKTMTKPPVIDQYEAMRKDVFCLVNAVRVSAGEDPLIYYTAGQSAVDTRAKELNTVFSHTRPNGSDYITVLGNLPWYSAGENIAMGQKTAAQVVEAWMNSQGHRENILRSSYTHLAVGVVPCTQDGYSGYCWAQLFLGL